MKLALFDLDHTLIPFDSGLAWTRFLVARGVLPPDAEDRHLGYCREYVAGTLDIHAMHRASVAPLGRFTPDELAAWALGFEAAMAPLLPPARQAWVARHRDAGDLCALVTATTRFVAEPLARGFGLEHVVATEAQVVDGRLTGEIDGRPCYRHGKLARVVAWLERRGTALAAFDATWFHSDSISDLPLLEAVSHPVAVCPDGRLRAVARERGWPVLDPD